MTGGERQDGSSAVVDRGALAASLSRLQRRDERLDLASSLRHVLESCTQLFEVTGSGLMIADDEGALRYVVATDGPGRLLEDAQLRTGQGPCIDTFAGSTVITCSDVGADPRYPRLGEPLRDSGIGAVLGVPVALSGTKVGSLDVYRAEAADWPSAKVGAVVRYARLVETMMAAALDAHQAGELAGQLQHALDHRVTVERAVGYLMARDGLAAEQAFERLRDTARRGRRRVAEVAAELLSGGRLPGEAAGP